MPITVAPEKLDYLTRSGLTAGDRAALPERQRQLLLERAQMLREGDRAIVVASLSRGMTVRELGRLLNLNAGAVSRRLASLRTRLLDPNVVALSVAEGRLDATDREIGLSLLLRKERVSDVSRRTGLTPAIVRKRMQFVRGWLKGQRDGAMLARQAMASTK